VLAALLVFAAAHHVAVILPYTPLWRPQLLRSSGPAGSRSLSLLIANVLIENRGDDRLLALIRQADPDIVLAVETDDW
jgi:endonuclease/exonuclease/phosphatase (EEP) superfamily protein YafD